MGPFFIYVLILLVTGALVGLATGLLGVGGGFILVPIQFFLLQYMGLGPDLAMRISLGTSLAVILPTALSGAYGHYSNKSVLFRPTLYLGSSGFVGALLGAYVASQLPGDILKMLFAILLLFVSFQFITSSGSEKKKKKVSDVYHLIFWGFIAGLCSGLLGIGGGVVMVPVMVILLGFGMLEAVGTSTAVIVIISIGGIISYVFHGLNVSNLPPYSWGYVNLLQFAALIVFSIPMARIGSHYAHRLPEKQLKLIFGLLLIFMALKMIGVFEILGIPL